MKSKTPEQIAAMRATILDIQMAVNEGKKANHEVNADRLLQLFTPPTTDTSPIWEIRFVAVVYEYVPAIITYWFIYSLIFVIVSIIIE